MKNLRGLIMAVSLFTCCFHTVFGQNISVTNLSGKIVPAEIEISFDKTTNLIFPYSIISVDRGSSDVLVQKAKGVENLLQLKAGVHEFENTNLSVVTGEGALYSFLLRYSSEPNDLNLRVSEMAVPVEKTLLMEKGKVNEYELFHIAKRVMRKKGLLKRPRDTQFGVSLKLNNIFINDDELYLHLECENRTFINYDIQQMRLFIKDDKTTKRTASQEIPLSPIYIEGNTDRIEGKSRQQIVLVLEKFTIPDKKNFIIQIFEKKGGRHLELKVKNKHLLKARPINGI